MAIGRMFAKAPQIGNGVPSKGGLQRLADPNHETGKRDKQC